MKNKLNSHMTYTQPEPATHNWAEPIAGLLWTFLLMYGAFLIGRYFDQIKTFIAQSVLDLTGYNLHKLLNTGKDEEKYSEMKPLPQQAQDEDDHEIGRPSEYCSEKRQAPHIDEINYEDDDVEGESISIK